MTRRLSLRAPAKINLDLRVLYRRPDGYHELRTVFQTISLYDEIEVVHEPGAPSGCSVSGNIAIEQNLIAKAAHLAFAKAGVSGRFDFHLEKRIPMGAGLGGGSSDAAAALRAISELSEHPVPPALLHELAAELGSDVPFFLHGGTALGLGRGEEVYPLPSAPPYSALLLTPDIHVSTPEAYSALSPLLAAADPRQKIAALNRVIWQGLWEDAQNDFEPPVFARHPELAELRHRLEGSGALLARMTGSGSALFGLFPNESHATAAARAFGDTPHHLVALTPAP